MTFRPRRRSEASEALTIWPIWLAGTVVARASRPSSSPGPTRTSRWEGSGEMQRLAIHVASPLSGWEVYSALSEHHPDFFPDDEGCIVSVDLGNERDAVAVLDSLQRFLDTRPGTDSSLIVSLDERRYRLHGELRAFPARRGRGGGRVAHSVPLS